MKHCAFVVSTGRTGTGFLTKIINECVDGAWSAHEPKPAFRRRARRLMHHKESLVDVLYLKHSRLRQQRPHQEDWYIENNFQLFAAMGAIRRAFPAAKIVHVVRDGRPVVRSYLNRGRYITTDHITAHDVAGDPAAELWCRWTPVQKNAWFWKTVNRHVREQGADVTIRFEDLFDGTTTCLESMLEQLGAPPLDVEKASALMTRPVNTNKEESWPLFEDWSDEHQLQFMEIAGDELKHWGYV